MRVLIIEDNLALRHNMAVAFEAEGHVADFAADGPGGLQLALQTCPDVVVLDLGLPGMDGVRVCEQLRARADRHVPVLTFLLLLLAYAVVTVERISLCVHSGMETCR